MGALSKIDHLVESASLPPLTIADGVILLPSLRVVIRNQTDVKLSDQQFLILKMVAARPDGVLPDAIANFLRTTIRVVHIQRVHANHKLASIGVRIASNRTRGGPGSIYRLEVT